MEGACVELIGGISGIEACNGIRVALMTLFGDNHCSLSYKQLQKCVAFTEDLPESSYSCSVKISSTSSNTAYYVQVLSKCGFTTHCHKNTHFALRDSIY